MRAVVAPVKPCDGFHVSDQAKFEVGPQSQVSRFYQEN